MTSATIIGGGVIGLNVAIELSHLFDEVYVLEKENHLGMHASGRSSEVIHAGIYYAPGSLKAQLCVEGNKLLRQFCKEQNIPHIETGKLVVATSLKEEKTLEELLQKGEENNVPNLKIISGREVKTKVEPNVNCTAALLVQTSAIFDTATYINRLAALAQSKGIIIAKSTEVIKIDAKKNEFIVYSKTKGNDPEPFSTDFLFNAAGVFSDDVAKMVCSENNYKIIPVRGEAAKFYKCRKLELNLSMNIYPVPYQHLMENGKTTFTTGVHLTPTLEDQKLGKTITICPLLVNPKHKEDYKESTPLEEFYTRVINFFPSLQKKDLQQHQCGISAKISDYKDFLIRQDPSFPRCIHLLGFDSPGMTASRAVGIYLKKKLKDDFGLR